MDSATRSYGRTVWPHLTLRREAHADEQTRPRCHSRPASEHEFNADSELGVTDRKQIKVGKAKH